ncbi:hypothetical protein ATN89_17525 [Comamonas thiooxydans]|uniref:hypothetical protein n=1 Tax=Comamonas thiooxydans TaxID=363952 RepID=UPI0007C46964|nr:hypothetical protein [Comamonas thiooxydans]OAD82882.1 hypothetical protein ATN89_17525 [Comamonas thiooxydans]
MTVARKPVKKRAPSAMQRKIMDFIRERGDPDLDEILDLTESASKASLQFTIRAMATKGLIVKLGVAQRRGRMRQTFGLAPGGLAFYDPRPLSASVPIPELEDEVPEITVEPGEFVLED